MNAVSDISAEPSAHSIADELALIYRSHAEALVRLAYVLVGDSDVAEDIASEAFVRVLARTKGHFRPESFEAYLRRTVINLSKSHARKLQRERVFLRLTSGIESVESPFPDVESHEALWQAVLQLPIRQRAALFFRFFEEMDNAQVSEVLGCSIGAVKSLIVRAESNLEKLMKGVQDESD